MSKVTISMIDHSGEKSSTGIYIPQLTAANFDTVVDDTVAGVVGRLRLAVSAISTMNEVNRVVTAATFSSAGTLPSNPYAQREQKLLVRYIDTVTNKAAVLTIPAPDLTLLAQTGTDVVDHTSNVTAAAFVTAFESDAVSADGNPVSVQGMEIVGRNV